MSVLGLLRHRKINILNSTLCRFPNDLFVFKIYERHRLVNYVNPKVKHMVRICTLLDYTRGSQPFFICVPFGSLIHNC
jgi:hypothetical protein